MMSEGLVRVSRRTTESEIEVALNLGPRDPKLRDRIETPLPFFNHLLEHIAWRAEVNLEVAVRLTSFQLAHVVLEDVGDALGRAVATYLARTREHGAVGYGWALSTIDEALSRVVVSFEGRALLAMDHQVGLPERVEGMQSEDIAAFFEGFVQGGGCTLHADVLKGKNGHHMWESLFRALGESLGAAMARRPWRGGITPGVAGPRELEVDVQL